MTCATHFICDCLQERMRKLENLAVKARLFVNSGSAGDCDLAYEEFKEALERVYEVHL